MTNTFSPSQLKQTILYLQVLSYISPTRVNELHPFVDRLQQNLGEEAAPQALTKACEMIVSFQQASREPNPEFIDDLISVASIAHSSPQACRAFQDKMDSLAELPGRAKAKNRLHRKKGCRFCETPCRYGYFALLSEPDFNELQKALEQENKKPSQERQPIQAVWAYTLKHLSQTLDAGKWHITAHHLGNLAYCLLMLSTAKSRYAFPEKTVQQFQERNQRSIKHYQGDES